ncbi:MAG TPA: hypothetical protein VIL86_16135 [Tepidisphaeraceae bacterium]|jgi:DNA repair exonuclease SbcCD ATPase subunit
MSIDLALRHVHRMFFTYSVRPASGQMAAGSSTCVRILRPTEMEDCMTSRTFQWHIVLTTVLDCIVMTACFSVAAAPPASQPAAEAGAGLDARIAELERHCNDLSPDSPDRPKLAQELMELKNRRAMAPTTAPATPNGSTTALPAWMLDQLKQRRLNPIQRELEKAEQSLEGKKRQMQQLGKQANSQSRREFQEAISQDANRVAEVTKQLREAEGEIKLVVERLAQQYPNGVMRCPTCNGAGEAPGDRRVRAPRPQECSQCEGTGVVGRDKAYADEVAGISTKLIAGRRAEMTRQLQDKIEATTAEMEKLPSELEAVQIRIAQKQQLLHGMGTVYSSSEKQRIRNEIGQLQRELGVMRRERQEAYNLQIRSLRAQIAEIDSTDAKQIAEAIVDAQRKANFDNAVKARLVAERERQQQEAAEQQAQEQAAARARQFPNWHGHWRICPVCGGTGRDAEAEREANTRNAGIVGAQIAGTGGSARFKGAVIACDACGGCGEVPDRK